MPADAAEAAREQAERFVSAFIRPNGLEKPCTPILLDALQRTAVAGRAPATETLGVRLTRVAAWPLAFVLKCASLGDQFGTVARWTSLEAWRSTGKQGRRFGRRLTQAGVWLKAGGTGAKARFARLPKHAMRMARHPARNCCVSWSRQRRRSIVNFWRARVPFPCASTYAMRTSCLCARGASNGCTGETGEYCRRGAKIRS